VASFIATLFFEDVVREKSKKAKKRKKAKLKDSQVTDASVGPAVSRVGNFLRLF